MDGNSHFALLAAAYVRGACQTVPPTMAELWDIPLSALTDAEIARLCQFGQAEGFRLHAFKRTQGLPRVSRVLGLLRGLAPRSLLDVGSGRGVFLWPLLAQGEKLDVTACDIDGRRLERIAAVARGGVAGLTTVRMDACNIACADESFDVVTALEVIEHIEDCVDAVAELVRVARSFAVISVPSKKDDNPAHIHRFSAARLTQLCQRAGARRVDVSYVHNHCIVLARCQSDSGSKRDGP